jgi:exodeoxyribonuclease VII large subunit
MDVFSVSQVNQIVKGLLDGDRRLSGVTVRGEASNYRVYPSGHHYFTLKDSESVLKCVMFRSAAQQVRFRPADGMKLIVTGRVSVYPRDGQYQLYAEAMQPDGAGSLMLAYERLKARLDAEGLFDPRRKKPLPRFPRRIALVTSPAGAAVRDMLRILGRRWPLCAVLVVPVRVQGEEAPGEIAAGLDAVNAGKLADIIITGRGGGSLEDLWAFNDEQVARAIFRSEIPVVSAVGHEPDVTIADYVADVRAATPSNAAELCVPDRAEWTRKLSALRLKSPQNLIEERRLRLDHALRRVQNAGARVLSRRRAVLDALAAKLTALDPTAVLRRGYALVYTGDGQLTIDNGQLTIGERVTVRLAKGGFTAEVETLIP